MAEQYCEPYAECTQLDGRVLLERMVYGPSLAIEQGLFPVGDIAMHGAAIRPFLIMSFLQRWVPREMCYAPVASIMSLAPSETVTMAFRSRRRTTFSTLLRIAAESSESRTKSRKTTEELVDVNYKAKPVGGFCGNAFDSLLDAISEHVNSVEIGPLFVSAYGSLLGDIGSVGGGIVGGALGGPVGAMAGTAVGGALGDLADNALGGGGGAGGAAGPAVTDTLTTVEEYLDTVERTESESTVRETTTSVTTENELAVTRTFSNPYRDRSLQLRFIPVFRRFEVITLLHRGKLGLAMACGNIDFSQPAWSVRKGQFLQRRILDPNILAVAAAELGVGEHAAQRTPTGVVAEHLNANAALYTKRLLADAEQQRDTGFLQGLMASMVQRRASRGQPARIMQGLAWANVRVSDNVVHVPVGEPDTAVSAWRLNAEQAKRFRDVVGRLDPERIGTLFPKPLIKSVHMYAGMHIEAAPGMCVLPDLTNQPSPSDLVR